MKVGRIRRFKKSYELTLVLKPEESETLCHAISALRRYRDKYPGINSTQLFTDLERQGTEQLDILYNALWGYWPDNFERGKFGTDAE